MSEKDLLQVQLGTETVWGTPVTPTVKLMGVEEQAKLKPGVKAEQIPEQRGSMAQHHTSYISRIAPEGSLPNFAASYEDVCYLLDNLLGKATPSGTGPYVRDYAAPLTSKPTPRIFTLASGGPDGVYTLAGAIASKMSFKCDTGGIMRVDTDFIGKNVATGNLAALSDRSVNLITADHFSLFIDDWAGTIGTTELEVLWYSFALSIETDRANKHGLGSVRPQSYKDAGWRGTLELTVELDANSKPYLDYLVAGSGVFKKQVRIVAANGAGLGLRFDFAGSVLESPELFSDEDGVLTLSLSLEDAYNPTLGNWFKAQATNGVSVLA